MNESEKRLDFRIKANSVADPGFFPRGVRQFQNWDYFANFFAQKLHENERILTLGGASLAPPLDPPMDWNIELASFSIRN